ncbi:MULTISPECIES: lipocalin family protein [Chryseobacterium]|jgi:hypothetical protein|uniref:Lipocalin-like domain-containing protein n=1 Tax=Chryseobacterium geocarposphaerae TaxID=1416776 RepID=A0ABU1LBF3_9FLAO|nr:MULTISPECIES: lipocalin family protein [Chryseobacterium]MDR6404051.1 hypothetical protein [Chryseobacterium geocarposphaerae]MDR6698430.1 hypothetical protein [Chryseobacterium ginsenosidimutans]
MKKNAIAMITFGILAACNPPSQAKNGNSSSSEAQDSGNKAKLIGQWLQPIPGMESEKQGFQLYEDGTAASVNMHTLKYEKWGNSGDTLFLWNHSEGVKIPSSSIDTLVIKKLDGLQLVVSPVGSSPSYEETYAKGK